MGTQLCGRRPARGYILYHKQAGYHILLSIASLSNNQEPAGQLEPAHCLARADYRLRKTQQRKTNGATLL